MPAKPLNPIDVYVGGRVRMRRIEVDMSQQVLGSHIDLTFQQIQKYEKGMNRMRRTGGPEDFQSSVKKDFFNTICHKRSFLSRSLN
jgi:DNA-binding XRE family transcriptional regulator